MKLESEGIIIAIRPFLENKQIISCFTNKHGILKGLVRKNSGKKVTHKHIIGNIVHAVWQSRLQEQLGVLNLETTKHVSANFHNDPRKLNILNSIISLLNTFLIENDSHPAIFSHTLNIFNSLIHNNKPKQLFLEYCLFELSFLEEIGFGLSLEKCVVSRSNVGLTYVSPKSGGAVNKKIGAPYHDKLLPLPEFLIKKTSDYTHHDLFQALRLTGFFLHKAAKELHKNTTLTARNPLYQTLE